MLWPSPFRVRVYFACFLGLLIPAVLHAQEQPAQGSTPQAPADPNAAAQQQAAPAVERGQEGADFLRRRAEWFYKQRAYPLGRIPAGARQRALEQMDELVRQQKALGLNNQNAVSEQIIVFPPSGQAAGIIDFPGPSTWTLIGPQPTNQPFGGNSGSPISSGRITAIAVDASDATGKPFLLGAQRAAFGRRLTQV